MTGADRDRLAEGVAEANLPSLLMVLVQLTGDERWLSERYRASLSRGLGDNDTGGLAPEVQSEVRTAALAAIQRWIDGAPVAIPVPSDDLVCRMMSSAMGEPIPHEYGPMLRAELDPQLPGPVPDVPAGFHAVVIGAGLSGLCAAVHLQSAGIPFTVLERAGSVGGVWRDNRYPGAGVDSPNHLYSFSFAPHDWSRYFAFRDEIHDYLERLATERGLRDHIRLGVEVRSVTLADDGTSWTVRARSAGGTEELIAASVVLSAVGIFNPPVIPAIPGLDRLDRPYFHTAEWPEGFSVAGMRVALVGNGASAMQVGPAVVDEVEHLTVFQRSPQWAAPFERFHQRVPEAVRHLMRTVPLYQAWYRARLAWTFGDKNFASLQRDPDWTEPQRSINAVNDGHRRYFTRYIESEVGERRDLLEDVVPTYPPFGKRMLMDNGWYRMVARPDVTLVTERIDHLEEGAVVTGTGQRHEVDAVVFATGFDVLHYLDTFEVRGRGGTTLAEAWDGDDPRAYLGLTVPGFPNFFCIYGPNTQPGHGGSLVGVIETSVGYVVDLIGQVLAAGGRTVEPRPEVFEKYNATVDAAHDRMVWTHPGMSTYYRNSKGRVVVNMASRSVDWWELTRSADLGDYLIDGDADGGAR